VKSLKSVCAALELLLVFPAALFMTALFVRNLQPQQYEPAHTAQVIVNWYAARPHLGLWVLLIILPVAVLSSGAVTLFRNWKRDGQLRADARLVIGALRANSATTLVAFATVTAGGILAIVTLHLLTD
jgi:hypothetical protein